MNKAVFLDRDGTVNKEVHYLTDPERLELLPKVAEAIAMLNKADFKVIIVTNQSAIARKLLNAKRLEEIHERLSRLLEDSGARIDKVYYCSHHPDDNCDCRKPKVGMLIRASTDFCLDLRKCFMVGDRKLDIETGKRAGCTSILIPGPDTEPGVDIYADYVANDLCEAADFIIRKIH
jgi:histidinol-phosphate phosphatase family protein